MLALSGPIGEKVYNDEVVTPETFAKLFKCPEKKSGGDMHVLEICPHLITKDAFGEERFPRSITQKCEYTVNIDGNLVVVRYYTNKANVGQGVVKYSPENIQFQGRTTAFAPKDYEQFLFMFTSPICKNSISASQEMMIQYNDPAAIEKAEAARMERYFSMVETIAKASDSQIIAVSRGINIRGEGVNLPQTAGVAQHRAALTLLLSKYQDDFQVAWVDDNVLVRGLVREAVNKDAVKQVTVSGRPAWAWASNGQTILIFSPNDDPFTALVAWALSPENHDYAKGAFTKAITGQAQTMPVLHPSDAPAPADDKPKSELRLILEKGVEKGVIWRDTENRIFYNAPKGPEETLFFDGEDWVGKFEKWLNTPGNTSHRGPVKDAVNA